MEMNFKIIQQILFFNYDLYVSLKLKSLYQE